MIRIGFTVHVSIGIGSDRVLVPRSLGPKDCDVTSSGLVFLGGLGVSERRAASLGRCCAALGLSQSEQAF